MAVRKTESGKFQTSVRGFPRVSFVLKGDAETLEADYVRRKKLGALYEAPPVKLRDELDAYLARCRAIGGKNGPHPDSTMKAYEARAAHWEPLGDILVSKLNRRDVEALTISLAAHYPAAARNALSFLKRCLRNSDARIDPRIYDIPAPAAPPPSDKHVLSRSEEDTLVRCLPGYFEPALRFSAMAAGRWGEVWGLTDDRVDLNGRTMFVPWHGCKEKRDKLVELTDPEVRLLRAQMMARAPGTPYVFPTPRGRRITHTVFEKQWQKGRTEARLPKFKWSWLRNTAISRMAENGMPPELIARRVGHNDGGALIYKLYRRFFNHEMRRALDSLGEAQDRPVQTDNDEATG
jgi:integrase